MSVAARPAYLVFDAESVPDGVLLSRTKYAGEYLSPEAAITRAQEEARAASPTGSDFLPVSFQIPVAICVARIGADFRLQSLRCVDAPLFRTAEMVRGFWSGMKELAPLSPVLVSFNGRGFDLPLLELAAFRYGVDAPHHFHTARNGPRSRYGETHLDLLEFITNFGASRLAGGLNLLSKLLGKPGKMEATGAQVHEMFRAGKLREINDYCSYDVLDTYFVFLRTRVLTGELPLEREQEIVAETKQWLQTQLGEQPHLQTYLDNWGDWQPWP
jgi:hypothetical protein